MWVERDGSAGQKGPAGLVHFLLLLFCLCQGEFHTARPNSLGVSLWQRARAEERACPTVFGLACLSFL